MSISCWRRKGVKPGKVGVVGYCFTGQMALRMAAAAPDKVAAAASFHGGFLVTDKPDSPHKHAAAGQGAALFRPCGGRRSATPEQIATLEAALRDWHGAFQSEVYEGASMVGRCRVAPSTTNCRPSGRSRKLVELFDATRSK